MEVIGVGMGRTGTTSIQRALEELGYRAYNFESVIHEDHFDAWRRLAEGAEEPDWPALFEGYDASFDEHGVQRRCTAWASIWTRASDGFCVAALPFKPHWLMPRDRMLA